MKGFLSHRGLRLLAVVSLLATWSLPAGAPSPSAGPNILLITVDTLRTDRVSAFGYERPTTPHLDRVIAQGVRFTQARTVEPLTGPALCSMVTSLDPHEHGATRNGLRMRPGLASLPKALQVAGYRTAAFVGNWTLRDKLSGLAEHFELYEEVLTRGRWFGLVRREANASDITRSFNEWLADHRVRHPDRPFLAWVHYVEPHAPYRLHREFLEGLGVTRRQDLPASDRYDTEIAFVDAAIGELLDGLSSETRDQETLIVFTSDHGESLGEHGYWGHGRNLYEPTLRIPMALIWPGRIQPATIDAPALITDLAPTILGLMGRKPPGSFRGLDWTPILEGTSPPDGRITHYQTHRGAVISKHDSDLARRAGLVEVGMIENNRKEIIRIEKGRRWLFDLTRDPRELVSLGSLKDRPTEGLLAWMHEVDEALSNFDGMAPELLDEESIEQLRSLGYVD